jgi:hypothetical protein
MRNRRVAAAIAAAGWLAAAGGRSGPSAVSPAIHAGRTAAAVSPMNSVAEAYVKLVLALGRHDADYVDAYYGPPEWKTQADSGKRPLPEIRAEADSLLERLARIPEATPAAIPEGSDELEHLRHRYLVKQLSSLRARTEILSGKKLTFDEESRALYDAVAPTYGEEHFRALAAELSQLLPGSGSLGERYEAFRRDFVVPRDKLDAVFGAAIEAGRALTKAHVPLPAQESFRVEYVTGKTWSGYNWYQGGFHSLIQVNTDLPIYIDRAVDLACHEGYPGHHVYNLLLEKNLVRDRGWIEFTVYPLFSPQSLIAEGSANFGIEVAFPGAERTRFERTVLFPKAGLDPALADRYARVRALSESLAYAGNEAARRYLNGQIDAKGAADWLEQYGLMARPRAEQRVRFIDQYRSYVINYNLGKDLVRKYIESRGGTEQRPEKRWAEFIRLLSSPRLPEDLATNAAAGAAGP